MATKLANDVDPITVDPVELIRRGTGLTDLSVEVIHADPWVAQSLIADTYSRGRIFLAGDACHLHPPFGGFGMNMGIGDAVDLGWKLAARLQGWGGDQLLDSYGPERRPVHERTIRESMANYAVVGNQLVRPALETEGPEGEAARRGISFKVTTADHSGLRERYGARFALIRADQYVAWRGDHLPDPGVLLGRVTGFA